MGYELPWGPLLGVKDLLNRISLEAPIRVLTDNPAATAANQLLTELAAAVDLTDVTNLPFDGNHPMSLEPFILQLNDLHKKIAHFTPSEAYKTTLAHVREKVDAKLELIIASFKSHLGEKDSELNPTQNPIIKFTLALLNVDPAGRPSARALLPAVLEVCEEYKKYCSMLAGILPSTSGPTPPLLQGPAAIAPFQKKLNSQ